MLLVNAPVTPPAPGAIWEAAARAAADPRPDKLDLTAGVIHEGDPSQPLCLEAVRAAERRLAERGYSKAYPGPAGVPAFLEAARGLLGLEGAASVAAAGCSAISVALLALRRLVPGLRTVHATRPAWPMYACFARGAGLAYAEVDYLAPDGGVDVEGLAAAIGRLDPAADVLVLQAVGYNPAGVDPRAADFQRLADAAAARGVAVLLDVAYQGVARDAAADLDFAPLLRLRDQVVVAQFFDKTLGLYAEGAACVHAPSAAPARLQPVLEGAAGDLLGVAPVHAQLLAAEVLGCAELRARWAAEMARVRAGLAAARERVLAAAARAPRLGGRLAALRRQTAGVFVHFGLADAAVARAARAGVHLGPGGRASLCGLDAAGAERLVAAVEAALAEE